MRVRSEPIRYALASGVLVTSLVACTDGAGPAANDGFAEGRDHPWQTAAARDGSDTASFDDRITTIWGDTTTYSELTVITHAPYAPPLETYDTSFTVVVGRPTTFRVHYEHVDGWARPPVFLEITIPRDAQLVRPDGTAHANGDSVAVPLTIHPERFEFVFQPHGSSFTGRKPATVWLSLRYADVGSMSPELLRVWYQATDEDEWTTADTEIDPGFLSLTMKLRHFSGYAIAW